MGGVGDLVESNLFACAFPPSQLGKLDQDPNGRTQWAVGRFENCEWLSGSDDEKKHKEIR